MNKCIFVGRITREPEVRVSSGDTATTVARYSLAVDRKFKRDGDQTADFINCVAFGKSGEFAEKYLHKGMKIAIVGRLQTGSYTNKEGQKFYTTDIIVEEHEFVEAKSHQEAPTGETISDQFMKIPDSISEQLPFN